MKERLITGVGCVFIILGLSPYIAWTLNAFGVESVPELGSAQIFAVAGGAITLGVVLMNPKLRKALARQTIGRFMKGDTPE